MFLNYDLPARRWVPYSYVYPFAEAAAGVLMITHAFGWLSIPIALFIGGIGAVSVFKAVYIDKRDIKCACVGGNSNVPLGFVSLTENVMRSEEHTSELQSLMRISYAVFCLKKKNKVHITKR